MCWSANAQSRVLALLNPNIGCREGDSVNSLPGGHSEREPPDPIPNSEVKTLSADDSVGFPHVKVGHCQALYTNPRQQELSGVFFCVPWHRKRHIPVPRFFGSGLLEHGEGPPCDKIARSDFERAWRARRARRREASRKEDTARLYIQTPSAQADGVFLFASRLVTGASRCRCSVLLNSVDEGPINNLGSADAVPEPPEQRSPAGCNAN